MKISQENLKVLLVFVFLLLCSFVFEGCNDTINHINHIKNGNEFVESGSLRDQISLPYVLWKNNINIKQVSTLGNNVYQNSKLFKIDHFK